MAAMKPATNSFKKLLKIAPGSIQDNESFLKICKFGHFIDDKAKTLMADVNNNLSPNWISSDELKGFSGWTEGCKLNYIINLSSNHNV